MKSNALQLFLILREWILDRIGTRDEIGTYLGFGNYETERGWFVNNVWYSYDYPISESFMTMCTSAFGEDAYEE